MMFLFVCFFVCLFVCFFTSAIDGVRLLSASALNAPYDLSLMSIDISRG